MYQVTESEVRKMSHDERSTKGRIYVSVEGNSPINPNIARHIQEDYREPTTKEMKALILPALLSAKNVNLLKGSSLREIADSARWSRTAGCSCGCSPGFKVLEMDRREVFITLKYLPDPVA